MQPYRDFPRSTNQDRIRGLLRPAGPDAMLEAVRACLADFSPSLFAELDWQEFRPDQVDRDHRLILGLIDDFLFVHTLPENLSCRAADLGADVLKGLDLPRYQQACFDFQSGWLGERRPALLAQIAETVDHARRPTWTEAEDAVERQAIQALTAALSGLKDRQRLFVVVEVVLCNARFRYLDLPWTRMRAKAVLRRQIEHIGDASLTGPDRAATGPFDIARRMRAMASIARDCDHAPWAQLLDRASAQIEGVDVGAPDVPEGDWTHGMTPCARCSMWFAFEILSSMDATSGTVRWSDRGIVFIPAGIGTAECPFCGFAAPVDAPALFYIPQRAQIVYLVPTKGMMSEDDAIEFWREPIEAIRHRYAARLDLSAQERFAEASDLVTHNIRDFLYAVQMGETISEDHVFNMVELADGRGLVWDGEKRFARVITRGELDWYRREGFWHASAEPLPEAIRDAVERSTPGAGSGDLSTAALEELLTSLADANDAFDAAIAERLHRHG